MSEEPLRRLFQHLVRGVCSIVPEIVGTDIHEHRKGGENHDERRDEFPFHGLLQIERFKFTSQYETSPRILFPSLPGHATGPE